MKAAGQTVKVQSERGIIIIIIETEFKCLIIKKQVKIVTNRLAGFNHATLYTYAKKYPTITCNINDY